MATRLLSLHRKLFVYQTKNLKYLSVWLGLRCFSSQGRGSSESSEQTTNPSNVTGEPASKWLNIRAGIFGPDDERLPLPGDVGLSHQLSHFEMSVKDEEQDMIVDIDKMLKIMAHQNRKKEVGKEPLFNFKNQILTNQECQFETIVKSQFLVRTSETANKQSLLESRVQECPDLLKKDFQALFHNINLSKHRLTVISLCQKTVNDMSVWSEAVELEREELLSDFVDCAHKICDELQSEGYWADFIDPSSGRPYLGPFTNATFFETDERYRHFGFDIEDLGCCKVISHRTWGSRMFVGAVFTNAPVNSDVVEEALNICNVAEGT